MRGCWETATNLDLAFCTSNFPWEEGFRRTHSPTNRMLRSWRALSISGFGESFDESKLIALPAGAVCVPSNVPHYGWARDGEAIYQEAGVGVTGASFVHPPDEQAERPNYFFFATPYKSSSSIPV
jgi:hypothetical protein